MKQINSLISLGILKNNIKRYYILAVLYLTVLVSAFPIYFFFNGGEWAKSQVNIQHTHNLMLSSLKFNGFGFPVLFITCALGFVLALLINRYINAQNSTIFNHSLPVGKAKLYFTNFVTGTLIIIVPLLITAIILILEKFILGWVSYRCVHVLGWLVMSIITSMFIYALTTFICMTTGSTIFAGLVSGGILSLEFVITYMFVETFCAFIRGTKVDRVVFKPVVQITPFLRFSHLNCESMGIVELLIYIILIIAFFFGGLYLYKIRKNEKATETIAFDIIKPIFKYIVTILLCTVLGLVFIQITNSNIFGTLLGYIIGLTVGYFASEMVIQKSIFVFKEYKGYIVSLIIFTFVALGMKFDVLGYETRIPALEDIESANFSDTYKVYNYSYDAEFGDRVATSIDESEYVKDLETIEKIRALHKQLMKTSISEFTQQGMYAKEDMEYHHDSKYVIYKLKNGKIFTRYFNFDLDENYELLKNLYEDDEYQYSRYKNVFEYNKEAFERLEISNYMLNTKINIRDQKVVDEFLKVLEKDIRNESYQVDRQAEDVCIELYSIDLEEYKIYKKNNPHLSEYQLRNRAGVSSEDIYITPEFTNTMEWLKQNGYYNAAIINSANVEEMILINNDSEVYENYEEYEKYSEYAYVTVEDTYTVESEEIKGPEKLFEEVKATGKYVPIINDYQIFNLMLNYNYDRNSKYMILYKLKADNIDSKFYEHLSPEASYKNVYYYESVLIDEDVVPDELKISLANN